MQERSVLLSANHKLDPLIAKQQIDAYPDIRILDVSPALTYHEKYIPTALNIPLVELGETDIPELPNRDETIYVIGRSEYMADIAVYNMLEMGYTAVFSIGAMDDWPFETISS